MDAEPRNREGFKMQKNDKCRVCRHVGEKLFLKGDKCNLPSCPFEKRPYQPGHTGPRTRPRKLSDYSKQLLEKQKARAIYGVSEKQMANYFAEARKTRHATGLELMKLLESRADNVVYRLGWAESRADARQIVAHGKIKINKRKVKSPSINMKSGDTLTLDRANKEIKREVPAWLKVKALEGQVVGEPIVEEALTSIDQQLIIEYYSK